MLEVSGLRKRFGAVRAVEEVSFAVGRGQSVGFLGPNGAGKTTTLSMVVGLLAPDAGTIRLDGRPPGGDTDPVRRKLGYVPQDLALYEELTALANLQLFGALYGLSGKGLERSIDEALDLVGLRDRARSPAGTFSGGMKRRLNLAAALLHAPEVLLLDEPTVGVDPQSRNAIFENLEALRGRGIALLYTTHYMEEVERLCERVVIIDHGRVVADDTLRDLYRQHAPAAALVVELGAPTGAEAAIASMPSVSTVALEGDRLRATLREGLSGAADVLAALAPHRPLHFATERPNLEAVFLSLTGKSLRDSGAGRDGVRPGEASPSGGAMARDADSDGARGRQPSKGEGEASL